MKRSTRLAAQPACMRLTRRSPLLTGSTSHGRRHGTSLSWPRHCYTTSRRSQWAISAALMIVRGPRGRRVAERTSARISGGPYRAASRCSAASGRPVAQEALRSRLPRINSGDHVSLEAGRELRERCLSIGADRPGRGGELAETARNRPETAKNCSPFVDLLVDLAATRSCPAPASAPLVADTRGGPVPRLHWLVVVDRHRRFAVSSHLHCDATGHAPRSRSVVNDSVPHGRDGPRR